PVAGMLLADFGADVLKVEIGSGDPARSNAGFAIWNRGKRSVVLSQSPEDHAKLDELLASADILIHSNYPADLVGTLLDHERLASRYPRLVIISTAPTYGDRAPWVGNQESDGLVEANGGAAVKQSSYAGGPIDFVLPALVYLQGAWAATCAVASLLERRSSGKGQVVRVNGFHGSLLASMQGQAVREGVRLASRPGGSPHGGSPFYRIYQCSNGEWLILGALTAKFHRLVYEALGREDLLEDPRTDSSSMMMNDANRLWVIETLEEIFRTDTAANWLARLYANDVPSAAVGRREDWLNHEAIRVAGLRAEVTDPERGTVAMPGMFVALHSSPGSIQGPAPRLGEHNDDADWRTTESAFLDEGSLDVVHLGPLDGIRVVDAGTMVAGPMTGSLLSELGADVVKLETIGGDPFRGGGEPYNRGMRSLSVDFVDPRGKEVLAKLIGRSDVYISSTRRDGARKLGLDYEGVRQLNERIIFDGITAFGEVGPFADDPGFDPVLQAMSGMSYGQGGPDEPVVLTSALNDVSTATLGVFGIVVALWHRAMTGEGQYVGVSLAQSSLFMQSGELVSYAGRPPALRGGRDRRGSAPDDSYYEVADGWIRVAPAGNPPSGQWGVPPSNVATSSFDDSWPEKLKTMSAVEAVDALTRAGIPAVTARSADEILADADMINAEYFHRHDTGPGEIPMYMAGRVGNFSRTSVQRTFVPPGLGEHSRELLTELGIDEEDIESLVADSIVKSGEPLDLSVVGPGYRRP
ncbi:MAG TPA: CoA transferase, partial [Acidimicrobiales bacterium]|nr:CoA transferase [Acidimicrobiales bacterium]